MRQYVHVSQAVPAPELGGAACEVNAAPAPSRLRVLLFARPADSPVRWIRVCESYESSAAALTDGGQGGDFLRLQAGEPAAYLSFETCTGEQKGERG
jgi:hypothetical protein